MRQHVLEIRTNGQGFVDITAQVNALLNGSATGLCHVFVQHTSASLLIQENADPAVRRDLKRWLASVCERDDYEHTDEGADDMPAHAKAALLHTHEMIPVRDGRLFMGTWQGLYLVEHRDAPHTRRVVVTVTE